MARKGGAMSKTPALPRLRRKVVRPNPRRFSEGGAPYGDERLPCYRCWLAFRGGRVSSALDSFERKEESTFDVFFISYYLILR